MRQREPPGIATAFSVRRATAPSLCTADGRSLRAAVARGLVTDMPAVVRCAEQG